MIAKNQEKIINVVVVKMRISVKMVITAAVHYNIIVEIVEFNKILNPRKKYSPERKEELIKLYYECGSMRYITYFWG